MAVAALASTLRGLMHKHLHALEQGALMRDLNLAVHAGLDHVHYATIIAAGWHHRRGVLVLSNAGHPPPLWYRAARDEWTWVKTDGAVDRDRRFGVPLGLFADASYGKTILKPDMEDLVVLYSDGASEATNEAAEELGRTGLLDIARELDRTSNLKSFGLQLTSALHHFRGAVAAADDESIIVLRRHGRQL
jgi:sigma-B regulation protein RsbU (phosphoserine phosphatase)